MGADLSRVRTDPLRDHSGVGLQQGRLLLDADFNEQVAIVDRRLRAQIADQSPAGVPLVSELTKDAFFITVSGSDLTIGAGRMYVDGLLAENHGDDTVTVFDPILAEPTHSGPVEYTAQPYWPTPDPLPEAGPHVVFLDVWDREVTALQAPDLVETAIGVDTTTRTQTVWQVRLLSVPSGSTCDSDLTEWDELTAPSAARLTTGTVPVDPEDDPCEMPPTGGYRGLENHLYRVELHDENNFKWSRENASVGSTVAEYVSATELRLASLGRDSVLRFSTGDWVEITDDNMELNRLPGVLRKVEVDDATNAITFSPALPTELQPADADDMAERHLRVIRWDQSGTDVDANDGLIPIPGAGTAFELEHGLTVEFSFVDGGAGKPGDYWVFAARSTDASFDELVEAPPRGIHHHYARLAMVDLPNPAVDCRPKEPPPSGDGCGCEVCLTPESHASGAFTIQDAVNSAIAGGGGTVVLCPGTYAITSPILLNSAASVTLRGEGPGSTIVADGAAIEISVGVEVTVTGLGIISGGTAPAILLRNCLGCVVDDITLLAPAAAGATNRVGIGLAGIQIQTMVRRCGVTSSIGVGIVVEDNVGLATAGLRITDNLLNCTQTGIDLSGVSLHFGELRIAANQIYGTSDAGIAATGLMIRGPVPVDGVLTVAGNDIKVSGGEGIVTGGHAVIVDNEVVAAIDFVTGDGIVVANEPPLEIPGHVQVIGNRVTGVSSVGIAVECPVRSLLVKQNVVERAAAGVVLRGPGPKENVSIDNNHLVNLTALTVEGASNGTQPIRRVVASPSSVSVRMATAETSVPASASASRAAPTSPSVEAAGAFSVPHFSAAGFATRPAAVGALAVTQSLGIGVAGVGNAHIVGNIIDGVGADNTDTGVRIGIAVALPDDVRITGNRVARVGHPQQPQGSVGLGISVIGATRSVSLADNSVQSGQTNSPETRDGWYAILIGSGLVDDKATGASTVPTRVMRASFAGRVVFDGSWAYVSALAETGVPVQLVGNNVHGGGALPAVRVSTPGDVLLHANWCAQPPDREAPAVEVTASAAIVQGNRAHGGRPSMRLDVHPDSPVIGNITSTDPEVAGSPLRGLGKTWSWLNSLLP